MIRGRVTAELEAIISLTVRNSSGHKLDIDAQIDTGFNGFLTLPPSGGYFDAGIKVCRAR